MKTEKCYHTLYTIGIYALFHERPLRMVSPLMDSKGCAAMRRCPRAIEPSGPGLKADGSRVQGGRRDGQPGNPARRGSDATALATTDIRTTERVTGPFTTTPAGFWISRAWAPGRMLVRYPTESSWTSLTVVWSAAILVKDKLYDNRTGPSRRGCPLPHEHTAGHEHAAGLETDNKGDVSWTSI